MKLKFKSSEPPDLYFTSIVHNLDLLLNETRAQRIDLADIKRMLSRITNDKNLQKQVDDYFEQDPFGSAFIESTKTSPQTELENK